MRFWLDLAEGPLFRFAFVIMVLGLLRLVILSLMNIAKMKERSLDKSTDVWAMMVASIRWLKPSRWFGERRGYYTATSIIFHLGLIIVPIFFLPHITLWRRGVGFGWPSINMLAADALTLLTILTGVLLVIMRAADRGSRSLSTLQDWLLTPLCVIVFVTGYLSAHPTSNPVDYNTMRLVHVLSGNLVLFLMPFTKLAHVVLLPFTNAIVDLSWKFVPGVGRKVRVALGNENRPI